MIFDILMMKGNEMRKKLTWTKIYEQFKVSQSCYADMISYWRPYDFATIIVHLKDGRKITYNYDKDEVKFVKE